MQRLDLDTTKFGWRNNNLLLRTGVGFGDSVINSAKHWTYALIDK